MANPSRALTPASRSRSPRPATKRVEPQLVRFNGQAYQSKYRNFNVDSSGRAALATEGFSVQEYPFLGQQQAKRRHVLAHQARPTAAPHAALARR